MFISRDSRHSVWYCSKLCPGNAIAGEVVKPIRCEECQTDLLEYSKYRDMCDYLLLTMLPTDAFQGSSGRIWRAIRVRVYGK